MGGEKQFFPALEVLVVIQEVITALAPWTRINAAVLAGLRGVKLAEGMAEGFQDAVIVCRLLGLGESG